MNEKAKIKELFSKISKDDNIPLNFSKDEIDLIAEAVYKAGYIAKNGSLKIKDEE